jgi:methylmalonyl-CoA mutase
MPIPPRILTAVPICDGHDSAIVTINLELSRAGIEVVYLGYNRSAIDIVRAAIQEDVAAVGISSYNGGHVEFFAQVKSLLKSRGAGHIGLFGGGGGTISAADAKAMYRKGTDRIFFPGESLKEIVDFVRTKYAKPGRSKKAPGDFDLSIAQKLTAAELGKSIKASRAKQKLSEKKPRVIGVTGPGGAGKTTLIDELIYRLLHNRPANRFAILSHDPSIVGNGALLGDRAAMICAQDDRVFMRSLGTRGQAGGVSAATARCLQVFLRESFDIIFIETVGIGQEALPFEKGDVDCRVLVMSPDYGSRVQLQKIAMLDAADVVVVNKADLGASAAAKSEIMQRLEAGGRGQKLVTATAKRHRDSGVDEVLTAIL